MTTAKSVAAERQLDWLLGEALGGGRSDGAHVPTQPRTATAQRWIAAALLALAVGTAFGVALLRTADDAARATQQPGTDVPWHEAHGPGAIDAIPADVVNLRCFDFDDAAVARLPRFTKLERLDLSGMDVDERGVSRSLQITDAGIVHLGALHNLRWLCLAKCHAMKGEGLRALEALPLLEHLDLTYSGVESPAVERLALLGNLRELVLSHCMNFHGRSLAEVAKSPGLRTLKLQACTTISAADAMHLAQMRTLRHLDLRDCQGRFRGQRAGGFSPPGSEEPPPPPVEDGIGITDAVVAAVAALPLETLLLGGSESLTDAIGESLAKMTTLRSLDLSNLPKVEGALFGDVPETLESLAVDGNRHLFLHLHPWPALPALRHLALPIETNTSAAHLEALLHGKPLHSLRLQGRSKRMLPPSPPLVEPDAIGRVLAAQVELKELAVLDTKGLTKDFLLAVATLPRLTRLDLSGSVLTDDASLHHVAGALDLQSLRLAWCQGVDLAGLRALADVPLRELDLFGTKLAPADIEDAAKAWPGCVITMPNGQTWRAPGPR